MLNYQNQSSIGLSTSIMLQFNKQSIMQGGEGMDKVEVQLLRDPDVKPTNKIIADGLGEASRTYDKFLKDLENYGISLMNWRFYKDGKAWLSKGEYKWVTSRGNNKVKPIFWLSIWEGFFKVSFFFSAKTKEQLLNLEISEAAKKLIETTEPHGKSMQYLSIIFNVENDKWLADIYALSELRKEKI